MHPRSPGIDGSLANPLRLPHEDTLRDLSREICNTKIGFLVDRGRSRKNESASKKLVSRVEKLKERVFHAKLGTVYAKMSRVAHLS